MSPVHDALVARLGPRPAIAVSTWRPGPAPSRCEPRGPGAEVTGLDLAPGLIETAKRLAGERRLTVRFDVGDVERLPYGDASFDVVSSAHGVVFAVEHAAVATELARVCRPGGRLGLTSGARPTGRGATTPQISSASTSSSTSRRRSARGRASPGTCSGSSSSVPTGSPRRASPRFRTTSAKRSDEDGVSVPRPYLIICGRRVD
jgi:SAM-dependent methyltransferase